MKKEKVENKPESKWKPMGKGICTGSILSIGVCLIGLGIYAILLANTQIAESSIPTVVCIITAISLLSGSMIATRKMESKGILTGLIIGAVCMVSMYVLSSIMLTNLTFTLYTAIMIISGMLCAGLGGIIGVNLHK